MKKLKKDIIDFTTTGAIIGVGSTAVAGVGNKAGLNVSGGLNTMSSLMPIVGNTVMGSNAIRLTKKLYKKKKKK